MLRILIVDDHLLIRCGLKQILEDEFGPEMRVDEAGTAEEAVAKVAGNSWDIVIMDINLPGRSGLLALQDLKAMQPKLPVLMLSAHSEEEFAVRVLKAGASGFIPKESSHVELIKAVRTALSGGKHLSESTAQLLVNEIASPGARLPHEDLSDRELQVLSLMGKGKSPTEIAKALSLSIKTVSTYRSRILEKMNLKSNAQLIHYVIKHHLVEL